MKFNIFNIKVQHKHMKSHCRKRQYENHPNSTKRFPIPVIQHICTEMVQGCLMHFSCHLSKSCHGLKKMFIFLFCIKPLCKLMLIYYQEIHRLTFNVTCVRLKWFHRKSLLPILICHQMCSVAFTFRAIAQTLHMNFIRNMCWGIVLLKSIPCHPQTNELTEWHLKMFHCDNLPGFSVVIHKLKRYKVAAIYDDFGARSRYHRQGWLIASQSILLGAITYPCLRYLLLVPNSSYHLACFHTTISANVATRKRSGSC